MLRLAGTFALGATMAAVAAAFGSPSLYVPGFALMLLAFGAGAWVWAAAQGATLERRPGPATVEEEREWPVELVAKAGLVPAPGGELVEPLLRGSLPMAGRRERRMRVSVTFERRGKRRLAPAVLAIRDPFGLLERRVEAGEAHEVLVLPRVEPVVAAGGGAGAVAETASGARPAEASAEIEMESLRPYREGAPASRIHWPTVARVGTLMERRLLADSDAQPLVVLDPTHSDSDAALDAAVRAAASLCIHLARSGGCALLLPGDRRAAELGPDLGGWPALHARLALVDESAGGPAARLESRRGAIFWVCARSGTPRGLERVRADRYLVSPAGARGAAAFRVAGCVGVALGRGIRRAA
ncbi:MAG TPA: DUF58 domain-containing protein [Thermoleophilaceae bacterium]|nr:DUF58 domain-containing protein [Thermoleophilaceae bacterium]